MTCKLISFKNKKKEPLTLKQAMSKYLENTPKKDLDREVDDIMLIYQMDGEIQYLTLYDDSELEYIGLLEVVKSMILQPFFLTFDE